MISLGRASPAFVSRADGYRQDSSSDIVDLSLQHIPEMHLNSTLSSLAKCLGTEQVPGGCGCRGCEKVVPRVG
jgi:hypothetical protein